MGSFPAGASAIDLCPAAIAINSRANSRASCLGVWLMRLRPDGYGGAGRRRPARLQLRRDVSKRSHDNPRVAVNKIRVIGMWLQLYFLYNMQHMQHSARRDKVNDGCEKAFAGDYPQFRWRANTTLSKNGKLKL